MSQSYQIKFSHPSKGSKKTVETTFSFEIHETEGTDSYIMEIMSVVTQSIRAGNTPAKKVSNDLEELCNYYKNPQVQDVMHIQWIEEKPYILYQEHISSPEAAKTISKNWAIVTLYQIMTGINPNTIIIPMVGKEATDIEKEEILTTAATKMANEKNIVAV